VALIARILIVLFALLVACVVAAVAAAFGMVLPASLSIEDPKPDGIALAVATIGIFASFHAILLYATLPAMLVIVLAEALRLRSFLFYGFAGAALALGPAYGWDLSFLRIADDDFGTPGLETVAAIGIAAGFVYWALAGRNAGQWRTRAAFHPPRPQIHPPA
jgi:hypothetical protein